MKWFRNRNTKAKLLIGFFSVAALLVVLGAVSMHGTMGINTNMLGIYNDRLIPVTQAATVRGSMLRIRANALTHIITQDQAKLHELVEDIKKLDAKIDEEIKKYEASYLVEAEKQALAKFKKEWAEFKQGRDSQTLALSAAGKKAEAMAAATGEVGKNFREASDAIDSLFDVNIKEAKVLMDESAKNYQNVWWTTVGAVAVGVGLALLLGWSIAGMIARPMGKAVAVLEAVAAGDLTKHLDVDTNDEVGQMASALNQALENMRSALQHIGNSAQSVASSSEELTSVSHQMSSNSEETAAQANVVSAASEQVSKSVQTVAAGAEEMSASIKEIAKNTSEAARVAKEAVEVAGKTNQTITKLGESSAEIGNVIKVITSIAEQTNLLALNATIEAARAGEAGKGFAVVANEVKELAKQTGEATEDISAKIGAIQHDTQGAVAAIQQISGIINQVNDIANTIASAVEEQSVTTNEMSRNVTEAAKGSNEIVQNITGVAQAAQSTASGATETQAAAQELARLATELQAAVSQFKYDADGHESKPVVRVKEKAPKAPHTPQHQPKPTYRPADTTLHAL